MIVGDEIYIYKSDVEWEIMSLYSVNAVLDISYILRNMKWRYR